MHEPTVVAVMLTANRPEMARRALASFRAQTYPFKRLLVLNSGLGPLFREDGDVREPCVIGADAMTIGALRNRANEEAAGEIIMHFDDDDWSHPLRMREQVDFLQASGKQCVGYKDLVFWDHRAGTINIESGVLQSKPNGGEAWLYSSLSPEYCVGTSLCYWRSVWQARPFADEPKLDPDGKLIGIAEDLLWQMGVERQNMTSLHCNAKLEPAIPMIVAGVHGGNTLSKIQPALTEWKRKPELDGYCRARMQ